MTFRSRSGEIANGILKHFGLELRLQQAIARRLAWLRTLGIDTILDVGANTGQFATLIRETLPDARIYSFEPLRGCFDQLVANMAGDARFQAYNIALGDENGQTRFYQSSWTQSSSLLEMTDLHRRVFPHTSEQEVTTAAVCRLDDFVADLVLGDHLLIKVDVQGAERAVLRGGDETIRRADVLLIEASFRELYKGQMLFNEMVDHLHQRDFAYMGSLSVAASDPADGMNIFEDAIFVRGRAQAQ